MSKISIEFNLPEDREEFNNAINGSNAVAAIFEIRNEIFRPIRKHGYSDSAISEVLKKLEKGEATPEEFMAELERKFNDILEDRDLIEIS